MLAKWSKILQWEELYKYEITVLNNSYILKGYWKFTYLDLNMRKNLKYVSFWDRDVDKFAGSYRVIIWNLFWFIQLAFASWIGSRFLT